MLMLEGVKKKEYPTIMLPVLWFGEQRSAIPAYVGAAEK